MPRLRYVRCDVFTDRPFGGNPLAVFTDARALDAPTMQALAKEMNLSESVFVLPANSGGQAKIRIFTPRVELAFAGHPTIGAAFVLSRPLQSDGLVLETGVGKIAVRIDRDGANPRGAWLDLPLPEALPYQEPQRILAALGLSAAVTPIVRYHYGISHILVQVGSAEQVATVAPDFTALAALGPVGIVAFAQDGPNLRARVFVPGAGVDEDPATGSAVAPLALHVHQHSKIPVGESITITQGLELGRPSKLEGRLQFDGAHLQRILVGGQCVLLGRGEWEIPGSAAGIGDAAR